MRVEGWEQRLAAYIRDAEGKPFVWGERDCALWASGWVRQCTGADFVSEWEGRYKTERGAKGLIRKRGYRSVEDIADARLTAVPVMIARRGDLLLHPHGDCLGICTGQRGYFLEMKAGLTSVDTLDCPKAWVV